MKKIQVLVIAVFILYNSKIYGINYSRKIELDMSVEDRIRLHGYPTEVHQVVTDDDYILPLYRIPYGFEKSHIESKNKSIVLVIHGMGGAPFNFIVLGSKRSLPYYLADREFDVWLFSARGVEGLPKKHKRWDWNEDRAYWLFSFHEIGIYDITASIDYILKRTKQKKLFILGHSAGGAEMYAMLSDRPEYNKKIKCVVNWGSAPLLGHSDYSFMGVLTSMGDIWKGLLKYTGGTGELLPQLQLLKSFIKKVCGDPDWKKICFSFSGILGSHLSILQDLDDMELIAMNQPPRLSSMQMFQFMDSINTGKFQKYDYGAKKNLKIYGQKEPPSYNLSVCTAPSAFFIGPRDDVVTKEDVYTSARHLPNVVFIYEVPFAKFTHTDYLFARNATELVYEPLYKLFKAIDDGNMPQRIIVDDIKNEL